MNNIKTLMIVALASPHLPVTVDFFAPDFGDWQETRTLNEWMARLGEMTTQANEDFDTYGGGFPPGIENGFWEVSQLERSLIENLHCTCEVPTLGCALPPNYGDDEIPF